MYKRYSGEFAGADGTLWRVEIHEDSETAFSTVGELSFPYDEPLLIEWEKRAKEEVIQGSSATLKLISPGDRTYVDLYSVKPCAVRLDVYRAGALYWRGTLDTELYEEPYESARGYTVSLTFSDFGVLARKKLYGHEVQSLRAILERALEAAGLAGMEIYDGYISSRVVPAARLVPETNGPTGASSQAEAGLLDELYVSGDNFYDEDGEAITAEEVVEGVLHLGATGVETNQVPCLSLVQFQVDGGGLVVSAYQRSSDASLGLPADIYHLYLISRQIELPLKSITLYLGNVHIYENNLQRTRDLLAGGERIKFELNV